MLKVKTVIGKSAIHGKGVFADEDIKEGQLVYRWNPKVDMLFKWSDVQKMTGKQREVMDAYAIQ